MARNFTSQERKIVRKLKDTVVTYESELHKVMDELIDCGAVGDDKNVSKTYLLQTARRIHGVLRSQEKWLRGW